MRSLINTGFLHPIDEQDFELTVLDSSGFIELTGRDVMRKSVFKGEFLRVFGRALVSDPAMPHGVAVNALLDNARTLVKLFESHGTDMQQVLTEVSAGNRPDAPTLVDMFKQSLQAYRVTSGQPFKERELATRGTVPKQLTPESMGALSRLGELSGGLRVYPLIRLCNGFRELRGHYESIM